MIRSRGEYKFVTIPETIRIDGGIMPARDVAGDGSWRQLRGEDPAFLMEGVRERRAALGLTAEKVGMDRALRASRLAGVARDIRQMAKRGSLETRFVKPFELNSAVHYLDSEAKIPWTFVTEDDLVSHYNDFQAGGQLRADPVRKLFRDMQLFRHVMGVVNDSAINVTNWDFVREAKNEGTYYDPTTPLRFQAYRYAMTGASTDSGQSLEWKMSEGTFTAPLPDTSDASLFAYCRTIIMFSSVYSKSEMNTTAGHSEYYYSYVPVPCAIEDGVASIAASVVRSAADSIISALGWEKIGYDQEEWRSNLIEVDIAHIHAVWTLKGHTDISPLGWTWEPGAE